jgi:phosphoserine phosphatase RsbU/P
MIAGQSGAQAHIMLRRLGRGFAVDPLSERDSVSHLLLRTLSGRALVAGAVVRLLASLGQLIVGHNTVLNAIGTAGTLAVIVATVYLAGRLIALAKRRLLWRVRRKLILSYIFVGLVPALLIIVFFWLCGLLLFSSVGSFVLQTRLRGLVDQTQFLARTAAIELTTGRTADRNEVLARKQRALESRYPFASLAVVPLTTCPSAQASTSTLAAPERAIAAGPWAHMRAPRELPRWIGCSGFAGVMAYWVGSPSALAATASQRSQDGTAAADDSGQMRLLIRAIAIPEESPARFAVVLDVPLSDVIASRLRAETGIEMSKVSLWKTDGAMPSLGRAGVPYAEHAAVPDAGSGGLRPPWVAFIDYTDWGTGRTGRATVSIAMSIGEMYDRLVPSTKIRNSVTFGEALVLIIVVVGVLFLIIQFVALVMGLALARSITGSVHELFVGTERVRMGDFSHHIQVRARDQLGELADSFNNMTGRLGQLLIEMTEKKRLEEELRIARDMQMSLLPQNPPVQLPGISLTALCAPAREVGGDYYDFLPLGNNRLGLLIADVSGKGTSAAFYMAEMKGLMLSLSQIHRSPRLLLIEANRLISANLDSRSFITMTYAVLDLDARTMTWARAGHTPLIHLPATADDRRARVLVSDGLVLGLKIDNGERFEQLLEEVTIPLETGDLFMFFTDGLSEQMNPGEELFGEARLGALIEEHGHLPFEELRERIVREVRAFAGDAAQHDDMTFILLRVDSIVSRPPVPIQRSGALVVS